jgi:peptidoglycan/xylan/chitin deacetylase (PgdA/CDA1 family)
MQGPEKNLAVSDKYFENHLQYLKENHEVISMDEMHNHILNDSSDFYVVITFDDGYKDNLDIALPLLEKYNMPATIYITTRFPEGDGWMWWYELEQFVMENVSIDFSFNGFSIKSQMNTHRQKLKCYHQLRDFVTNQKEKNQLSFLTSLTGNDSRKDYSNLMLDWSEIRKLSNHDLITIGAHTHTHPNLKILSKAEVESEMKESKHLLEEKLGFSIKHFAYPFGKVSNYGLREIDLLIDLGYKTAVGTHFNPINFSELKTNYFSLPRLAGLQHGSTNLKSRLSGTEAIVRKFLN